jgi:hypothetical protein
MNKQLTETLFSGRFASVTIPAFLACIAGVILLGPSVTTKANAQSGFSNFSLKGDYGYGIQGSVNGVVPLAGFGLLTADGSGGVTGTETTQSAAGLLSRTFRGTYVVNADGSGTLNIDYTDIQTNDDGDPTSSLSPSAHYSFVLVDARRGIRAVRTDSGFVVAATMQMQ